MPTTCANLLLIQDSGDAGSATSHMLRGRRGAQRSVSERSVPTLAVGWTSMRPLSALVALWSGRPAKSVVRAAFREVEGDHVVLGDFAVVGVFGRERDDVGQDGVAFWRGEFG